MLQVLSQVSGVSGLDLKDRSSEIASDAKDHRCPIKPGDPYKKGGFQGKDAKTLQKEDALNQKKRGHPLVNGGFPLFWYGKSHVSTGCKMRGKFSQRKFTVD